MIIKSFRIPTAYGSTRIRNHIFSGEDNVSITVIRNTERDLQDMFRDAQADGRRYAVRHFIISPECPTSRDELLDVFESLAVEFDFDAKAAVIIEHEKPRATPGVFDRHLHGFTAEWDRVKNKTVSTSHSFPRQEKTSRLAEWALGHPLLLGRHHRAVVMALHAEGHGEAADALEKAFPLSATPDSRPPSHAQQQQAVREGVDLVALRKVVRDAWKETATPDELHEALAKRGLLVRPSAEPPFAWIVTCDGRFVGKLAGLAHVTKTEIRNRMGEPNGRHSEASASVKSGPNRPDADRHQEVLRIKSPIAEPVGCAVRGLLEPCNGTGIAADDEEALAVGLGRRAEWLRRLDELADIAALPPTLRAERDLAPIEQRCLADLSADHAPPPEPAGLIRARRQEEHYADLEFAFKKAINQCSKRLENLRNARPLLWGRAEHSAALAAQQQRHNALQERIPHVIENARIWKNWRKTLQEARDSSEKKRIDQVQRTLAHAQMKLASVGQVRNVIKLSPKVVQWGGSTLYAMMIAIRQADFRHQAGADSTHVDVDPDYEVHIDIWGVAQLPAP